MELSIMITRAQQQRNATATQFDSLDFFVRRLEEYERTLSALTTRIEESYAQEINYSHQLLGILNELRCHFEGIAEESECDVDWFEESATQPKERGSWKTTVNICPKTVGDLTSNGGLPGEQRESRVNLDSVSSSKK